MDKRTRYEIIKENLKRMAVYILGNLTKKEHEKSESRLEKITIEGPLTIENSPEIVRRVHESLRDGGLVLDLTRLKEYDTACAGVLLGAVREAKNSNHELIIIYNGQINRSTENLFHIQSFIDPYIVKQGAAQQPINSEV